MSGLRGVRRRLRGASAAPAQNTPPERENKLAKLRAARDELKAVVAAQAHELEALRSSADLASGRDRADLSYLFVVTYGRSGSTLLQGILSATPGVVIRGENRGCLTHLYEFHQAIAGQRDRLTRDRTNPLTSTHPWWGIDGYRDETGYRNLRTLMLETVLRPEADTRVVGFKEIHWPAEDLPAFFEFMRDVFPGARFVLNVRDLDAVSRSGWWASRPDAREQLAARESALVTGLRSVGDAAYTVRFDEYVADPTVLRGLFEWLGEPYDEDRIRAVMAIPHSY